MSGTPTLPTLTRYEHYCSYDGGGPADAEVEAEGSWVRYEDVIAALASGAKQTSECQYSKDVGMPEYRCAVQCQYPSGATQPSDDSKRYRHLISNYDVRTLVGVSDFTTLDVFLDREISDDLGPMRNARRFDVASGNAVSEPHSGFATPPTGEPLTAPSEPPHIGPNELEAMAKARPNDHFLKGSGVLKLLQGIRTLEAENRALLAATAAPTESEPASGVAMVSLPAAEWASLDYWLDRCESKGHLENCADLIEPYEALCKAIASLPPHPTGGKQ